MQNLIFFVLGNDSIDSIIEEHQRAFEVNSLLSGSLADWVPFAFILENINKREVDDKLHFGCCLQ